MQATGTKKMAWDTASMFLIRFFPTLAILIVTVFFSRRMGLIQYGQYQKFWTPYYLLSSVATLGLPAVFFSFSSQQLQQWLGSIKLKGSLGILAWLVVLCMALCATQRGQGSFFQALASALFILNTLGNVLEALLLACSRKKWLLMISMLQCLAFLFFHYQFISTGCSFSWLIGVLLLLSAFRTIFFLLLNLSFFREIARLPPATHSRKNAGTNAMNQYWLQLGMFEVSQSLFRWLDKFVVSFFLSAGALAVYFNGSLDIPFLPILLGAAGNAVLMHLNRPADNTGSSNVASLLQSSGRWMSSIVFPVFFFFLCYTRPLFSLVFAGKYSASVPVFLTALLVLPLRAYNFTTLLQQYKKGWIITGGALLDLLIALGLCYPLYCWLGLPGIAAAFVLSTYCQCAFYLYHAAHTAKVRVASMLPLMHWLLKLFILAGVYAVAYFFIPEQLSGILLLSVAAGITLACICAGLFFDYRYSVKQGHGQK